MANPAAGTELGNPADAKQVREFALGYRQLHFDHGMDARAAAVFSEEKLSKFSGLLKADLDQALVDGDVIEAFLLSRDRSLFLAAYGGHDRASESGKLRHACLRLDARAHTAQVDFEAAQRGQDLHRHGRGKKQAPRRRTASYTLTSSCIRRSSPSEGLWTDARLDAGAAMCTHIELGFELGVFPEGPEDFFIFPTLSRSRREFDLTNPMNSNKVNSRLEFHLRRYGLWAGETSHSFKRSSMVHSQLDSEDVAARASLTPGTVEYYRDLRRPARGPAVL